MEETTNFKVLTLLIIDRFLPLKVHSLLNFPLENYYSVCIVIAKTFLDLDIVALTFMAGYSYWLYEAKNK